MASTVDGGIVLNGLWSFASGIDFVDWENLQVFIPKEGGPPNHRFVLVPKQDFTIVDDWFVNGLCGTGSKSIEFKDVFVPEHRVLNTQFIGGGPSPGSAVNPGPSTRCRHSRSAPRCSPGFASALRAAPST